MIEHPMFFIKYVSPGTTYKITLTMVQQNNKLQSIY